MDRFGCNASGLTRSWTGRGEEARLRLGMPRLSVLIHASSNWISLVHYDELAACRLLFPSYISSRSSAASNLPLSVLVHSLPRLLLTRWCFLELSLLLHREAAAMADDESAMSHLGAAGAGSPGGDRDDTAMDGGEVQIDSSDEYDPARDISFPGLPEVPSTSASRPTSKHDSDFTIQRHPSSTSIGTNGQLTPMAAPDDPSAAAENTKQFEETAPHPNSTSDGARLPHDLIGILEDRIAEDERGDLEGWLSLINEHKKRGQIEEIRKVYERFFEVFPHAVSLALLF